LERSGRFGPLARQLEVLLTPLEINRELGHPNAVSGIMFITPICKSSPMLFCQIRWPHMQRIFQAAAWLLAGTIVVLSLGPPSVRPVTGAAHALEHLLIFLATGMAFGLGYPRRVWLLTIALPTFAAAIEVAQNWVPGRHARMSDFLVDAAASCLGVGLSYASLKLRAAVIRR